MTGHGSTILQYSYKFRLYPTSAQRQQLAIEFGHARWIWNKYLRWRAHTYQEEGEKTSGVDFSRELMFLKKLGTYEWLKDASAIMK